MTTLSSVFSWLEKHPEIIVIIVFTVIAGIIFFYMQSKEKEEQAKIREQEVAMQVIRDRFVQVIDESLAIVKTTKNTSTRLSRMDVAITTLETMIEHFPDDQNAIDSHSKLVALRPQMHREALEEALEKHMVKARSMKTLKSRINSAEKALVEVESAYSNPYIDRAVTDHYKNAINQFLDIQVNDFAEKARKYEFKGQYDKAADAYLDALFHIKNDAVGDELQADQILEVERLANDLRQRAREKGKA